MSASRGDGMCTLVDPQGCLNKLNLTMQIKFLLGEVSNAVGQPGLESCVIHLDCGYPQSSTFSGMSDIVCKKTHLLSLRRTYCNVSASYRQARSVCG